jgi:hypothetical protein
LLIISNRPTVKIPVENMNNQNMGGSWPSEEPPIFGSGIGNARRFVFPQQGILIAARDTEIILTGYKKFNFMLSCLGLKNECEKQELNLRTPSGTDLESASVGLLDILA